MKQFNCLKQRQFVGFSQNLSAKIVFSLRTSANTEGNKLHPCYRRHRTMQTNTCMLHQLSAVPAYHADLFWSKNVNSHRNKYSRRSSKLFTETKLGTMLASVEFYFAIAPLLELHFFQALGSRLACTCPPLSYLLCTQGVAPKLACFDIQYLENSRELKKFHFHSDVHFSTPLRSKNL